MDIPMGATSMVDADGDPQGFQASAVDLLPPQKRLRRSPVVHGSTATPSKQHHPAAPGPASAVGYHPNPTSSSSRSASYLAGKHPVGKVYASSYAGVGNYGLYATSPPFAVEASSYVTPYGTLPTQPFFYSETSSQLQGIAYPNGQPYHAIAANPASTIYMPSDIRDAPHELVDPQCAEPCASTDSIADDNMTDWDYYSSDASIHLKLQSLPILESLADRLLSTLTLSPLSEVLKAVSNPETGQGQAFTTLLSLFIHNKQLYSRDQPFLDARALHLDRLEHHKVLRKANLATFISSFYGQGPNIIQLHDHFLSVFVPLGHRLLDWQGSLFVELKTQVYILAAMRGSDGRQKAIEDLFPDDMEARVLARHPGSQHVTSSEVRFLESTTRRKQELLNLGASDVRLLSQKYHGKAFLDQVGKCIQQCFEEVQANYTQVAQQPMQQLDAFSQASQQYQSPYFMQSSASMDMSPPMSSDPPDHSSNVPSITAISEQDKASTQALYERARQTASVRSSQANYRRSTAPTQRRPWSVEEERALMDGLDRVKGPHWSQILALYGAGGTVSEVLKERNQVQLKDKARNLKLFFLKSGVDVPYYLQSVTGELKTRAPAQAAKREALKALKSKGKGEAEVAKIIAAAPQSLTDMVAGALQRSDKQRSGRSRDRNSAQQPAAGNRHGKQPSQITTKGDTGQRGSGRPNSTAAS